MEYAPVFASSIQKQLHTGLNYILSELIEKRAHNLLQETLECEQRKKKYCKGIWNKRASYGCTNTYDTIIHLRKN